MNNFPAVNDTLALLDKLKQTVRDFAASEVQKERSRFHPGEPLVVEKVPGLRRQRHMAGDKIRLAEQTI